MKKLITFAVILCMGMALLAACGGGGGSSGTENPGDVYRVIVNDESGAGVQGVTVRFCSDEMCVMGETDESGIAVFKDQAEGKYTVHILKVPEGYAEDETEYAAPETYGDVTVTLRSQ